MTSHYDDEAQVEQLRRWWKENWMPLLGGLSLGLVAIFAWEAWGRYKDNREAAASHLFEDLRKSVQANKLDDASGIGDKLQAGFESTPYAANGALKLAQAAFDAGKLDEAQKRLEWAVAHSDDAAMRGIASLRLARVLWQEGKPDDALKLLDGKPASFAPIHDELRGDITLAKGDRAGAYAAYSQALQVLDADSPDRQGLQRKLDDLADSATVKS